MNQSIAGRMQLESNLRKALQQSEFYLLYQPKVDIHTGKVRGAEALIRWARPNQGIIPPAEFIPIAEESNLIVQIDAWVLEAACQQTKRWEALGFAPVPYCRQRGSKGIHRRFVWTRQNHFGAPSIGAWSGSNWSLLKVCWCAMLWL